MLTDLNLKAAKPAEKPFKLSDSGGLYLHVMPNGARYWRYKYRMSGREKTLALGVYPSVSLVTARERHAEARQLRKNGVDPSRKKQSEAKQFEAVAREWYARWISGRNNRHAHYVIKRLEADVFPEIGRLPLSQLSTSHFRKAVQKIEKRGALDIAKRVLQTCGQIMRYAVAHDLTAHNPVAEVKPADVLRPHKRRNYPRVDASELPDLLRAIDSYIGAKHTRLALQLMVLTFVRTSELIGARWSEFDLNAARWNVPAERMKMKTAHIVPLSTQAQQVLDRLQAISFDRDLVFPGDLKSEQPMSNNTILFALYRLGYRGRMTGHGFRGIASTVLHEQGFPHEHIEVQLAHQARNAVSAAYNHALYLRPRAEMMQAWADHLDKMRNLRTQHAEQRAA